MDDPSGKKDRGTTGQNLAVLALSVVLLAAVGLAWYLFTGKEQPAEERPGISSTIHSEPESAAGEEEPLSMPAPAAGTAPDSSTPAPPALEPVPPALSSPVGLDASARCARIAEHLTGFFTHLENREYITAFSLQDSPQEHFIRLANSLLSNPPVVSREADDLYTILRNTAHFFRIIGKENILLCKAILDREREKVEDIAADLYQWSRLEGCESDSFNFHPDIKKVYEYAGFFLNTLGGRSYLFRRDSRSRLLVSYYSILIVEQADREGMNRHGIDIRQAIPLLIDEIDGSNQLIYKEHYLERLDGILEEYQQD